MPAGNDGEDLAMASEATDVMEEVGTALLTEEETKEKAEIESGKASDSGSEFDWNNLFDSNDESESKLTVSDNERVKHETAMRENARKQNLEGSSSYSEGIRGSDLSLISSNQTEFENSDDEDAVPAAEGWQIMSLSENDAAASYHTRNDLPDFITTHGPVIHQPQATVYEIFCSLWRNEI